MKLRIFLEVLKKKKKKLCILKGISVQKKNLEKLVVPTLPKIFRPVTRNTLKIFNIPRRSRRDIVLVSSVHSPRPHFLSVRNHISVPIGQI